jgi:hypothetical protein
VRIGEQVELEMVSLRVGLPIMPSISVTLGDHFKTFFLFHLEFGDSLKFQLNYIYEMILMVVSLYTPVT